MKRENDLILSPEVQKALHQDQPVVALESAVITHGLPYPVNLQMAESVDKVIRENNVTPATIALLDGQLRIGLSDDEIKHLSEMKNLQKISTRNLSIAVSEKWSGGTTVAGTLFAARKAGIKIFSTGGIGGVHRNNPYDVSADLLELGRNPLIVVCSGAKAILDLPATFEVLETYGIPIVGFGTDEFPAFYSSKSGLPVDIRIDKVKQIVALAQIHWKLGLSSAILVGNPPPKQVELSQAKIEESIQQALAEAEQKGITGSQTTPFLLDQVSKITKGESLKTNLALLENNAKLASRIALALHKKGNSIIIKELQ
jgi:pseudouridine-5'-phosphate glycosidase